MLFDNFKYDDPLPNIVCIHQFYGESLYEVFRSDNIVTGPYSTSSFMCVGMPLNVCVT